MADTRLGVVRRWPDPLVDKRFGPLAFRLLPAGHPTGDLEKLIALVGALGLVGLLLLPLEAIAPLLGGCSLRRATGIACLSCGTTRAVLALAEGDLLLALRMNPLFAAAGMAVVAYTPVSWALWLAGLPRPRIAPAGREGRWAAWMLALLAVAANWIFVIIENR